MSYPTYKEMWETLHKAKEGTRRIRTVFRRGKEYSLIYLWELKQKGVVSFEEGGEMMVDILVASITDNRNFVGEENPPITIILTDKFRDYFFIERLCSTFAKFEAVE